MIAYMTASEAAEKWNISHRRVITLCRDNRIPDVAMLGNMWIIPRNAEKPLDGRKMRYEKEKAVKPFVKWAGGKGQLLETLKNFYPNGLGISIKKYCEPMVGAGAVLFDVLNTYEMDEILINDANTELINVYDVIKYDVQNLIIKLSELEKEHLSKDNEYRKEFFYSQRELYNNEIQKPTSENSLLRASLFIYLNKTCFNGLYRVNRRGLFNVPMGSYKNPTICDKDNLSLVSQKLKRVTIISGDYSEIKDFVDENTFVYFDPPYRPLTKTADFTSYNVDVFNDKEQIKLAEFIKELSAVKAKVLVSNSDPKNIDEKDNFFDDLYAPLNINRINAKRSINSNGNNRGKISELLISNY